MTLDPQNALSRAEALAALGQTDRALAVVKQGLAEHPDHVELLVLLSRLYRAADRKKEAEAAALSALANGPDNVNAHLEMSNVHRVRRRPKLAIAESLAAVKLEPDEPATHASYALAASVLAGRSNRARVRRAYQRALELSYRSPNMLHIAALIEHDFGDVALARSFIEEGLALEPLNETLLALRAEYAPVGLQTELLTDVLTLNPADQESKEVLDAVVTWRRRVAIHAPILAPLLAAGVLLVTREPALVCIAVALGLVTAALGYGWYRSYFRSLPKGYQALRRAEFRTSRFAVRFGIPALGAPVLAAVVSFASLDAAIWILLASVVLTLLSRNAIARDEEAVLATARLRTGLAWYGPAYRFGSYRQELELWTGIAVIAAGITVRILAAGAGVAKPTVLAGAIAFTLIALSSLVRAGGMAENVPHGAAGERFLRFRFLFAVVGVFVLFLSALFAITGAPDLFHSDEPKEAPFTVEPIDVPTFDYTPIPIPTLDPENPFGTTPATPPPGG